MGKAGQGAGRGPGGPPHYYLLLIVYVYEFGIYYVIFGFAVGRRRCGSILWRMSASAGFG